MSNFIYAIGIIALIIATVALFYAIIAGAVIIIHTISHLLNKFARLFSYLVYIISFKKIRLLIINEADGVAAIPLQEKPTVREPPRTPPPIAPSGEIKKVPPPAAPSGETKKVPQQGSDKPKPNPSLWRSAVTAVNVYLQRMDEENARITEKLEKLENARQALVSGQPIPTKPATPPISTPSPVSPSPQLAQIENALAQINARIAQIEQKAHSATAHQSNPNALNNLHAKIDKIANNIRDTEAYTEDVSNRLLDVEKTLTELRQSSMFK